MSHALCANACASPQRCTALDWSCMLINCRWKPLARSVRAFRSDCTCIGVQICNVKKPCCMQYGFSQLGHGQRGLPSVRAGKLSNEVASLSCATCSEICCQSPLRRAGVLARQKGHPLPAWNDPLLTDGQIHGHAQVSFSRLSIVLQARAASSPERPCSLGRSFWSWCVSIV